MDSITLRFAVVLGLLQSFSPAFGLLKHANAQLVVAVAAGSPGLIGRSEDGGSSWDVTFLHFNNSENTDVHFVNSQRGWVAGGMNGTETLLLRTNPNGGWQNISYLPGPNTITYGDVFFTDVDRGWMVGSRHWLAGNTHPDATIWHTVDGGDSWSPVHTGVDFEPTAIYFTDTNNGWIVGNGLRSPWWSGIRTSDGGTTWQPFQALDYTTSVDFVDSNHGWVVWGPYISNSTDGGITWSNQPSNLVRIGGDSLRDVDFVSASEGWVVGTNGTILRTFDGGASWIRQNAGTNATLESVKFINSTDGWIAGHGTILRTTDGGQSWTPQWNLGNYAFLDITVIVPEPGSISLFSGVLGVLALLCKRRAGQPR